MALSLLLLLATLLQVIVSARAQSVLLESRENTIAVRPGETRYIGYNITYPYNSSSNNNHTLLLQSGCRRNVPSHHQQTMSCVENQLSMELSELPRQCIQSGQRTDWYVLKIRGMKDVANNTVCCYIITNNDRNLESCGANTNITIKLDTGADATTSPSTDTPSPTSGADTSTSPAPTSSNPAVSGHTEAVLNCKPETITTDITINMIGGILAVGLVLNTLMLIVVLLLLCRHRSSPHGVPHQGSRVSLLRQKSSDASLPEIPMSAANPSQPDPPPPPTAAQGPPQDHETTSSSRRPPPPSSLKLGATPTGKGSARTTPRGSFTGSFSRQSSKNAGYSPLDSAERQLDGY